jgi:hypothetical protein
MRSPIPTVQIDAPEVRVTEWRLPPGSATGHHRPKERAERRSALARPISARPASSTTCATTRAARSYLWTWSSSSGRKQCAALRGP